MWLAARFPTVEDFVNGPVGGGALARAGVEIDDTMAQIVQGATANLLDHQVGSELKHTTASNLYLACI